MLHTCHQIKYLYFNDATWDTGWGCIQLGDGPPYQDAVLWPLPKHLTYEVVLLGGTWYVLRRGTDCHPDQRFESSPSKPWRPFGIDADEQARFAEEQVREGEKAGSICDKCGGVYTLAQCPECLPRFGGES